MIHVPGVTCDPIVSCLPSALYTLSTEGRPLVPGIYGRVSCLAHAASIILVRTWSPTTVSEALRALCITECTPRRALELSCRARAMRVVQSSTGCLQITLHLV